HQTAKALVHCQYRFAHAIAAASFEAAAGQVLGLPNLNGPGKTTTLKCAAGLLTLTAGMADSLGFAPPRRSYGFLSRIGFAMGRRGQSHADVPVCDSLELRRVAYGLAGRR
ncbi:MAG: ABC transporter, partial [Propionibacteriaceae bacterium]|nr:ABC transporter [Propionibacteriaceae bacterium]